MAGRPDSAKLWTVPSMSPPVSVTAMAAASSAPLAEALLVTGASLTGVTVMVAVAGVASEAPPSTLAANSKVVTPFHSAPGTK